MLQNPCRDACAPQPLVGIFSRTGRRICSIVSDGLVLSVEFLMPEALHRSSRQRHVPGNRKPLRALLAQQNLTHKSLGEGIAFGATMLFLFRKGIRRLRPLCLPEVYLSTCAGAGYTSTRESQRRMREFRKGRWDVSRVPPDIPRYPCRWCW